MPPHRDWTRHGVGRALLWWPFTAFVTVAVFPALAVPAVVATGAFLIVIGLVGGFVGRRRRARRLRDARRAVAAFAPRAIREAVAAPRETDRDTATRTADSPSADAEDDPSCEPARRAA